MKVLDLLDFFLTFTTLKAGRIPWPAGAGYYVHGAEGYGRVQDVCKVRGFRASCPPLSASCFSLRLDVARYAFG